MLGAALLVWAVDLLLSIAGIALPAALVVPARVVLAAALLWLLWRGARWLFDRFLWRIRTKLILSYLFIALVPVVLLGVFFTTAATFFLMLSASRLVRAQVERSEDLARATASAALVDLPQADAAAAASLRERLAPMLALQPKAAWTLLRGGRVVAAQGAAPRELPSWWKGRRSRASCGWTIASGGTGPGGAARRRGPRRDALRRPAGRRVAVRGPRAAHRHPRAADRGDAARRPASPRGARAERGSAVEYDEGGQRVACRRARGSASWRCSRATTG